MKGQFKEVNEYEQIQISGGENRGTFLGGWNSLINGLLHLFNG